jgi:hypothetical protein
MSRRFSRQTTASPSSVNDGAQLGGRRGDGGVAVGPVIAAASEQPRNLAVAAHDQPVAVVLETSCTQSGPDGGLRAREGMQGSTKPSVRMRSAGMLRR